MSGSGMEKRIYSVGIYARLSVDSHSEKNESIENQIAIAKAFLETQPDMVLFDCYTDLGRTGTDFDREGFRCLMEDVRRRKVSCIVVKDLSRLGRNYIETGNLIQRIFPFLGVRFIAVADSFDSLYSEENGLSVNLLNLTNEMYARDIGLKVKSSKRLQRERGGFAGGRAPYGYRLCFRNERRGFAVDTEAAQVVKKLFWLCGQGKSVREMGLWLLERKIHSPGEYRRYGHVYAGEEEVLEWSPGSIRALLANTAYMEGEHEPIVTEEEFQAAARNLERRRRGKKKADSLPEEEDIFEGLLFCGRCGRRMGRSSYQRKDFGNRTAGSAYGYFCRGSSYRDSRFCERKYISSARLEALVRTALGSLLLLGGWSSRKLEEQTGEILDGREKLWDRNFRSREKRIKGIKRGESEKYLEYRSGSLGQEEFCRFREESKRKILELEQGMEEDSARQKAETEEAEKRAGLLRRLAGFDVYVRADRAVVSLLIDRIRVYEDQRIEILFRFQDM